MAGINETARLLAELELRDKFSGPARNIGTAVDGLERKVGGLQSTFGRVGEGLGQMGRGVGQIGHGIDQIATRAVIAAAGIGTALVTTAASYEEAFTGVQKTVDATEAQFAALEDRLKSMAGETGTAFEELSRVGEMGGALGVGIEDLDEFIDVVNRLSVSTDLTSEAAATALGQLGTVLHLTGEEYEDFADTLVALGNAGASTEPQIVELAARFAAAGNRAGLSADEILALSSAVASMGVEVEAGGTALSQTFNEIALAIGHGGDEVQGFTDVLGISAEEFRRRWETDALGTFQDFLQEIGKLDPIAQAVALEMAGITGVRQLNAVGLMADNWEFVGQQIDVTKDKTGALGEESDKFFGTSAAGFRKLRENVRNVADTIGDKLLPVANELITEFIGFLNQPGTQAGIKAFGEDLAEGIRSFVEEIRKADFGPLIGTLQGAASIAKGAFDAFRSLPQPIQQLALAAIVANKVTGGAVGSIASGLGNIVGGLIKIAFERGSTPANPLWVQSVGGGIGAGPGGVAGRGGLVAGAIGTAGAAAVATGGVLAIEDIASGTEQGIIRGMLSQGVSGLIGRALGDPIQELIESLGIDLSGTPGRTPGTASFTGPSALVNTSGDQSGTSQWARGLDGVKQTVESGTAQWVRGLSGLESEVISQGSKQLVKQETIAAELGRVKSEVISQGGRQLAKQEAIAAAVRANTSILSAKEFAPKFNLTANVTTNVSISEIQRRITSSIIAIGGPASGPEAV